MEHTAREAFSRDDLRSDDILRHGRPGPRALVSRSLSLAFGGVAALALSLKACGGSTDITIGVDPAAAIPSVPVRCDPAASPSCAPSAPPPTDASSPLPEDASPPLPPPPPLPVPCDPTTDTTCTPATYASELGTIANGRVECFAAPTANPADVELKCIFFFASLGVNAAYVAIGERNGVKMVASSASYLECPPGPSPVVCPPKVVPRSMLETSTPSALWGGLSTTPTTDGTVVANGINSLARIRPNRL